MRIWQAYWMDDDGLGAMTSWHPSKREAEKELTAALRQLRQNHDDDGYDGDAPSGEPCGVRLIKIPTDKKGLIDWLNRNLVTDNG